MGSYFQLFFWKKHAENDSTECIELLFLTFFSQKHAENDSTECIELFCAKNRVQKHQIVEI